jgi:peptidoglycan/xylan/chitin deacetylase (PgdA/CDA1 family)
VGLKGIKIDVLKGSRAMGVFSALGRSQWRTHRLLILGYHGVSQEDEHLWNPALYISQDRLRQRMESLVRNKCSVLSLSDATARLERNELPPRSVVITFDDGYYDFLARALPVVREFGFPATVYQTSFYSSFNRPVFDVACAYVLWKGARGKAGNRIEGRSFTGDPGLLDLSSVERRAAVSFRIRQAAHRNGLTAEEKDQLVERLARQLEVDWERIRSRRLLHLMTPTELQQVARDGVDLQLHTHRHRTPSDRALFHREVVDNRDFLAGVGQPHAHHFCYPSGVYSEEFLPWLRELGVRSATTCDPGLASRGSQLLLLPRLMDSSSLSEVEFEGWLHGVSHMLPRRPRRREPLLDMR